ncbi:hypothetical protein BDZ91DRAFT_768496 [Kalaharituber pfeilii]|nr:hypothetical protein BDZ91DRAFT_768496 [Kalaharituber pfeilii]
MSPWPMPGRRHRTTRTTRAGQDGRAHAAEIAALIVERRGLAWPSAAQHSSSTSRALLREAGLAVKKEVAIIVSMGICLVGCGGELPSMLCSPAMPVNVAPVQNPRLRKVRQGARHTQITHGFSFDFIRPPLVKLLGARLVSRGHLRSIHPKGCTLLPPVFSGLMAHKSNTAKCFTQVIGSEGGFRYYRTKQQIFSKA